jgi:hypothetical protein
MHVSLGTGLEPFDALPLFEATFSHTIRCECSPIVIHAEPMYTHTRDCIHKGQLWHRDS